MHLKRQDVPKNWPITRKGSKYVVRPDADLKTGLPLLIVMRDILKIARNRKEVKKAINNKSIVLNGKNVLSEKESLNLLDKLSIIPSKKYYQLSLSPIGKFTLEEISEKESKMKVAKILNKKTLKGKKTQINLGDGRNFISDISAKINDSVVVDFSNKKISHVLPLKEKSKVLVVAGKHMGKTGIIEKIEEDKKMIEIGSNKDKINVLIKQIMVIE
ncbi:MAG TPA: KOW motif-containing protein [Candidatus Nanoarchaeia archaeon]|nr:KOW motif-containing protein [Candidatus Nanoarchaeia archaeon]